MNSLHIFGDSFAVSLDTWSFNVLVSNHFNLDCKNYACAGSGLDYTYQEFENSSRSFNRGDYLIIVLTELHRRFFFVSDPSISVLASAKSSTITPQQRVAFTQYQFQLSNKENYKRGLINFLYHVDSVARILDLKALIIKAFDHDIEWGRYPNLIRSEGTLFEISKKEFNDPLFINELTKFFQHDPRTTHLCASNHIVLSNAIINSFTHNTSLILSDYKFKEKFIDRAALSNEKIISDEKLIISLK